MKREIATLNDIRDNLIVQGEGAHGRDGQFRKDCQEEAMLSLVFKDE